MIGEGPDRADRLAIDAASAYESALRRRLKPGPKLDRFGEGRDLGRNRKAGRALADAFLQFRPAQPAPGREQGNRLENIGFPGAILSMQDHHGGAGAKIEMAVGTELRQLQPADGRTG